MEKWETDKEEDELRRYRAREFIEIIGDGELIKEFDIDLYFRMIEKMVVFEGKVIVGFLNGTEVECLFK